MAKAWLLRLSALAIFACLLLVPQNLSAQGCTPKVAEPVIYGSSLCSGANFGSTAYIDASVFYNSGKYGIICGTINAILLGETSPAYPTAGAVIDARGILQAPGFGNGIPTPVVQMGSAGNCGNVGGETGAIAGDFNSDGLLDFVFENDGEIGIYVQQ